MLRRIRKIIGNRIAKPLALRHIRKERDVFWFGIKIRVSRGVFHPMLYFSTKFMLKYLDKQELRGATFLEMGAGSGLISIWAALQKARVTAVDISQLAIADIRHNADRNRVQIELIHSDLWENVPPRAYDFLVVNPPYYPKYPATEPDRAWYCGENFEFFHGFFGGLRRYIDAESVILMVLSEDCALDHIREIALDNGYSFQLKQKGIRWGEWNYIYAIEPDFDVDAPVDGPIFRLQ